MGLRLPKRIPIRVRTAATLTIPLVMLLVVAGIEVTRSGRERADVREQSDLATASIGPAGAINALMSERNYTSLWLFGVEGTIDLPVEDTEDARRRTDESLAAFEAEVRAKGGQAERVYSPAIEALDVLDDIRGDVDGYDGVRNPLSDSEVGDRVWETYNDLVTGLADATTELAYEIDDDHMRRGVRLIDMAAREVDRISQIVRFGTIEAVRAGGPITDPADFGLGVRMITEAQRRHAEILDEADAPYAHLRQPLDEESDATGIFDVADRFVDTGVVDIAGLLQAVSIGEDESYYGFIHDVSDIIRDRADHLNDAAQADQRTVVVLAALLLLAALAAALVVARSITRPLESLTRQAREMASRRLPDAVREVHDLPLGHDVEVPSLAPIAVRSRDEVADVAEQLNAVQTAALDLAVEQAVLRRNFADVFVNLCRRIQGLLGRQLEIIDEFSATEARKTRLPGRRRPPDLAEVSRYAVRLRRHAESLLVLAGVEPRPDRVDTPTPLPSVVALALSEVSDTERVRVVDLAPVVVVGPAVADLAHLLAELVEGALRTIFPEERVTITGSAGATSATGASGPSGGYTLHVADPGSGIAQDEIERANRRLAGVEEPTTAPSKYLGQYVTARLAARHGVAVSLQGSVVSGITATVELPPLLLAPAAPPEPAVAELAAPAEPATAPTAPTAASAEPSAAAEPAPATARREPAPAAAPGEAPPGEGEPDGGGAVEPAVEADGEAPAEVPEREPSAAASGADDGDAPGEEPEQAEVTEAQESAEQAEVTGAQAPVEQAEVTGAQEPAAEAEPRVPVPARGDDPHPSGPNLALGPLRPGDERNLDVYSLLADFPPEEVERPALATPTPRRPDDSDPA
jgi:signal transduction histidine kinase